MVYTGANDPEGDSWNSLPKPETSVQTKLARTTESFKTVSGSRTLSSSARATRVFNAIGARHAFTETTGTIFYRKRTPEHEILETLALLAEGNRISSLSRVKGFKEDTILAWLREAAHHAEAVEEALLAEFKVKRGQLDALWAYVGNKGEKKLSRDG
jgi:hypothetical protein